MFTNYLQTFTFKVVDESMPIIAVTVTITMWSHIRTGKQWDSFKYFKSFIRSLGFAEKSLCNYERERIKDGRGDSLKISTEFILLILKGSGFEANIRPYNESQITNIFTFTPASSLVLQSEFGTGQCGYIKYSHHENTYT